MISSNETHILHLIISIMFLQWWYGVVWLLPKLVLVTQLQYLLIGVLMSGWYFKGKWHYLDLCLIDNSMCIAKKKETEESDVLFCLCCCRTLGIVLRALVAKHYPEGSVTTSVTPEIESKLVWSISRFLAFLAICWNSWPLKSLDTHRINFWLVKKRVIRYTWRPNLGCAILRGLQQPCQ